MVIDTATLLSGLYLLVSVIIHLLMRQKQQPERSPSKGSLELIVVARNEEENLPDLLASLEAIPADERPERISLVNDHSTDQTLKLMREFQERQGDRVRILEYNHCRGKIANLKQVLQQLEGDIITITDADCQIPSRFFHRVRRYYSGFSGLLAGPVFSRGTSDGFLRKWQHLDEVLLMTGGVTLSRLGLPQSVFGANLTLDQDTLQTIDFGQNLQTGYAEDLQLNNLVRRAGGKVRMLPDPDLTIMTTGLPWRQHLAQKTRWLRGGRYLSLIGKLLVFSFLLMQAVALAGLLIPSLFWLNWLLVFAGTWLMAVPGFRVLAQYPDPVALVLYPFYLLTVMFGIVKQLLQGRSDWTEEDPFEQ